MHEKGLKKKHQEYRDFILELVLLFKPKTYCEIGIQKGYVYNHIVPHVKRAVAVDKARFKGIKKGENTLHFQMSSADFIREWSNQSDTTIDLLFIDADHRCKQVLTDFEELMVFVPEHTGLILLHDTYPISPRLLSDRYCSDAWKAAKFIRECFGMMFEIVTLPGPISGLSIIRKALTHGWMDEDS